LHLRDVAGQKQLQEIGRAGTTIRVLAFSPDGKVLAAFGRVSTSPNEVLETIGLWEVCTGSLIRRLKYDRVPSLVPTLSFSPDGRHLLCCGFSEQAFLWDLSCWPAAVQGEHGRRSFAALWRELSGNDTPLAHQAMWQCVANPKETVEAFTGRLLPAAEVSAKTLASLIDQLDSDDFTAREKATRTLAELGNSAEGALREAAKSPSSAEAARRIEKLLALLEGKSPSEARALAALEQIGTPEAKKLLERLAKGAPDACLTREAKESLARLLKRRGQGRNGRSPTEERKETKE
jgi:hypothetical protein